MIVDVLRSFTVADWFGVAATMMIFYSQCLEIKTIFIADPVTGQKTRPSRSTFWIWTVVQIMMVTTYLGTGETIAAGVGIAYASTILVIAFLSIRYGYSTRWEVLDWVCAGGALITVLLWYFSIDAVLVLLLAIATDFFACIPTIMKVWKDPTSESRMAWAGTVVACGLNFFAVKQWGIESLLYIPYLFLVNSIIAYGIWFSPQARIARNQRMTK